MNRGVFALAWNGFREARRNRVTAVVALFAFALLLTSTLVTEVTVATFDRVLTDVGLGAMNVVLVLLAIFLSSGLLSKEIERRTIFLIMAKPISRGTFLVSRLVGNMITLGVLLVAMGAVFLLQLVLYGSPVTQPQLMALALLYVELFVLTCFGFMMSSFSSQLVSAMTTVGVFFAGHLGGDIYNLASRSKNELLKIFGKVIYYLLPNLDRLNVRPQASHGVDVEYSSALLSAAYGLAYGTVLIALAIAVFRRRDFK